MFKSISKIIENILILAFIFVKIMVINRGNFDLAINNVLQHEGGYIFDPIDPGGETNFGISKRSYPNIDIKNLTKSQAMDIYYQDFLIKNRINEIKDEDLASKILDMIVNIGPTQGFIIISRAIRSCGIKFNNFKYMTDGLLLIINSFHDNDKDKLIVAIRSELAGYYRLLARLKPQMSKYINGWLKRAYDD